MGKVAIPAVELAVDAFVCVALPEITGVGNVDCTIGVDALDTDNDVDGLAIVVDGTVDDVVMALVVADVDGASKVEVNGAGVVAVVVTGVQMRASHMQLVGFIVQSCQKRQYSTNSERNQCDSPNNSNRWEFEVDWNSGSEIAAHAIKDT